MRLWMSLVAILLLPAVALPSDAPRRWSAGYTLVLLEPGADAKSAMQLVQAEGGTVAVVVPPRVLLGWLPAASDAALLGREGIRSIHREPLTAMPSDLDDRSARAAVRSFGSAVRGELDVEVQATGAADPDLRLRPDALDPGPIDFEAVRANLRAVGKGHLAASLPDPQLAGNSDYMSGTVTVSLFFVESNGMGADPNLFSWTTTSEQQIFDQAVSGLSWWSNQALNFGACWVAFYIRANFATQDARCAQTSEPVLHTSGEYATAISTVLGQFGYGSGNHLSRANAYNVAQRATYGTDWAYCVFVAANPTGANQFTDGRSAWAYLGGPYTALLQRSFGWPFGQVFAHESGHIFRACDEYYQEGYGGCTDCGPCGSTGVPNANCELCNPGSVSCMMRANSYTLCTYTPGQVGWWRDPCGPGQLPAPVLTMVSPSSLNQDSGGMLQLQGQNFTYGMQVEMGAGIQVLSAQNPSSTLLQVQVQVDLDAPAGPRDVVVRTPDAQTDTLFAGIQVVSTPRHYVSSTGGNVYPFTSPTNAGNSLTAVLAACSDGDTLLLAAGTYGPSSITIQKSLVLRGGYDAAFTARAPDVTQSILQGNGTAPVVRLQGLGAQQTLDGLVIRGGSGELVSPPEIGSALAGAGVLCYEATGRLVDCVIENNSAGTGFTPGFGGGVFVWNAVLSLEGCEVRSNVAMRGGGIFAVNSVIDLTANRIEANQVDGAAGTARGAGLGAIGSQLRFVDDVVRANTGAAEGGGLYLENCPSVTLEGVLVEDHAASGIAGGILGIASRMVLRATAVLDNTSGSHGGGIVAQGDSLDVVSSQIVGNLAGGLGGGVRAIGCVLRAHNATVTRNTGGYGSGVYAFQSPAGSEVRNSIVASNTFGGIVFEASTTPAVDWNLVWSNGALDYFGAAAGPNDRAVDPLFVNAAQNDVHLALHAPGIDAGDPQPAAADPDGSRNDRGAYGGPLSRPDAPPRVQGLQAVTQGPNVQVSWSPSTAGDVASYAVYRSTDMLQVVSAANLQALVNAPAASWTDGAPVTGAWYVVSAVDASGYAGGYAAPVQAGTASDAGDIPPVASLHAASPGSLRRGVWVQFALPRSGAADVAIYSVDGRLRRTLHAGSKHAGVHRSFWDGRDDGGQSVAPGVYLLRFALDERSFSQKLVLTR